MRHHFLFSTLILFSAPVCVKAAEPPASDNLETVVVSATRTEQPRDLTGSSISVISSADIEVQHLDLVTEALRETPGLMVVRNGGAGQPATIGLRGAGAGQTLFRIDGVRINDPTSTDTQAIIGDLVVNNIERIEVLRGPQSTLYGSDAIGGVVEIFTRRGGPSPFSGVASAEGGTFGTYRLNAAGFGTAAGVQYGGAINLFTTQGIAAADTRPVRTRSDGYQNISGTVNARVPITAEVSVDARAYYVNSDITFDGFPPPDFALQYTGEYAHQQMLALYGGVNVALLGGRFRNRFAVTQLKSDRKYFNPGLTLAEEFYGRGGSSDFEYQGVFDVTPTDQITIGAESLRTNMTTASPNPFDADPAPVRGISRINSGYVQYQTTVFDQLTLTGGYRHDDDKEFGAHDSVKATAAWGLFGGSTILRGNYGDGFKAPSLYQLFSPYSNPVAKLAPETARGWEAGADQKLLDGRAVLSAVWFQRDARDEIDFFSCFGVTSIACKQRPFGYYDNIHASRAEGVEIEASAQIFDSWRVYGNLTDMSAVDATTHNELARRPRMMGNARVVWSPDAAWAIGASVSYNGKRYDDPMQFRPLQAFAAVNLFATLSLNDRLQLFGRAENLFDAHYETAAGYRSTPRSVTAGLRLAL